MNHLGCAICLILIFICTPAASQFYRYTDKDGHTIFTDDLNQVPIEQRSGTRTYTESKTTPEPKTDASSREEKPPAQKAGEDMALAKERFDKKKSDLKEKYNALMKNKKALIFLIFSFEKQNPFITTQTPHIYWAHH